MIQHLLNIADLTDDDLDRILAEAGSPGGDPLPPFVIGLLFLSSSLRTRVGFAVAAARLGGSAVTIEDPRFGAAMSAPESFADTVRTVTGMVDLLVVRPNEPLDRAAVRATSPVPVVNGGDPGREHPTQALIDLAAIRRFAGDEAGLTIGICGDLGMRATRSLLALLGRRSPRRLVLIAPASRNYHGVSVSPSLSDRIEYRQEGDFSDLDVLHLGGLAPKDGVDFLDQSARARFALTAATVPSLGPHAVVLSPMPVIDEIALDLRSDPRVRIHEQSDLGVSVRRAVLRLLLVRAGRGAGRDGSPSV